MTTSELKNLNKYNYPASLYLSEVTDVSIYVKSSVERVFSKFKPQKFLLKLFPGIKDQSTVNYQKLY